MAEDDDNLEIEIALLKADACIRNIELNNKCQKFFGMPFSSEINSEINPTLKYLNSTISKYPQHLELNLKLSLLYYHLCNYSDALEYIDKAVEIEPTNKEALKLKCSILKELNRPKEYTDTYEKYMGNLMKNVQMEDLNSKQKINDQKESHSEKDTEMWIKAMKSGKFK